ncbi:hypothetical protein RA20_21645 [Leisingera sp. ANG-Vp]|nr:hypothetical protein RA20_21645 [Leisingera sp. ANG-Vp]
MLSSAVARNDAFPDTFKIPSKERRSSLERGEAVQLLFDIETREAGKLIDRGIDRMWVIVIAVLPRGYQGVLDSDPGTAENLKLFRGDLIEFGPDHICKVDQPPEEFLKKEYGEYFQ